MISSADRASPPPPSFQLGDHTYELLVYIQFDKWVQQVIDEQVHVRCRLEREAGELKAVAQLVTLRNKASSRSRAEDGLVVEWEPLPLPAELLQWQKNRPEGNSEPISCWMDIVRGDSLNGKPVMDHLLVGDDTTMVLKIRQSKGLDTRITSCVAHDGSGEQAQDLIDEHGIKSNPKTGVKVAHSTFKAFKFPDRDNLHLRCTVLVCLGSCNLVSLRVDIRSMNGIS
ncbi:hypothetical protein C7M84_007264 [Penaeus vannamei]|uniref:Uncharacterized protein n=1 Tax=Penaeus vannamei TaxID=6689 RepID=A0A3R7PQV4_PENVA|nr:hypothetical protein C7M84_007264 [Penaeus vannamei]